MEDVLEIDLSGVRLSVDVRGLPRVRYALDDHRDPVAAGLQRRRIYFALAVFAPPHRPNPTRR
jgi:hypothetical protein